MYVVPALVIALILFVIAAVVAWPLYWAVLACAGLAALAVANLP